jgi:hypothetical protein
MPLQLPQQAFYCCCFHSMAPVAVAVTFDDGNVYQNTQTK